MVRSHPRRSAPGQASTDQLAVGRASVGRRVTCGNHVAALDVSTCGSSCGGRPGVASREVVEFGFAVFGVAVMTKAAIV
jgi:hypothetical protein